MRTVKRYVCEICEYERREESEAVQCEAKGILDMRWGDKPEVGDIVECGQPYGWHSKPDTIWARKFVDDERHSGPKDVDVAEGGSRMYQRIFVVSAITMRHHDKIYHLYSPEPPQGPNTVYTCWGHSSMRFAEMNAERADWVEAHEDEWRGNTSDFLT